MQSKFIGDTKGNTNLPSNRSKGGGGSGDSHAGKPSSKFIGETKGNRDLPSKRS